MKYINWKLYYNYEKEEKWINEMSAKGLALCSYSWCRYVFEDAPKSEYTYRIELLKNLPTHPESVSYLKFLEETGIEHVASYFRWIYLRKKTADGEFDLFSDIDSKIKYYRRVWAFWFFFTCLEFVVGLINLVVVLSETDNIPLFDLSISILPICFGLLFYGLSISMSKKIKCLKKEKAIRE